MTTCIFPSTSISIMRMRPQNVLTTQHWMVSASVQLINLSRGNIMTFANFSSVLILDISQKSIGIRNVFRISCGDALNFNETSVNISIVQETVPNVYNFSVSINTSMSAIYILTVTWN